MMDHIRIAKFLLDNPCSQDELSPNQILVFPIVVICILSWGKKQNGMIYLDKANMYCGINTANLLIITNLPECNPYRNRKI